MPLRTIAGRATTALLELSLFTLPPWFRPSPSLMERPDRGGDEAVAPSAPPPWTPPPWLQEDGGPISPWAIDSLGAAPLHDVGPQVQAQAAFLADLDRGEVLYARRPDAPLPVASLTKLVSALTLMAEEPDLDRTVCVGPEHYPPRPGARSRFETGVCHVGWDWLGGALVASDNRGAMGLPSVADLTFDEFVAQMGEVGRDIGMQHGTWADPSGIEDGNRASARDMARAAVAVAAHPTLSMVASAPVWTIERDRGPQPLNTTNKLIARPWDTFAAKTGYTDLAGYCFASVVTSAEGGTYVVVVLGAPSSSTRFGDVERMVTWADSLP